MLTLEKRKIKTKSGTSIRYYIRGTCPYTGERVRESAATGDYQTASDKLALRLQHGRQSAMHGAGAVATFSQAVVHYLGPTVGGSSRFLDPLLDEFGTTKLASITDKDIADLCTKFQSAPACERATMAS